MKIKKVPSILKIEDRKQFPTLLKISQEKHLAIFKIHKTLRIINNNDKYNKKKLVHTYPYMLIF